MLDKFLFKYIGNARKYILISTLIMSVKVFGTLLIGLSFALVINSIYFNNSINYFYVSGFFLLGIIFRSGSTFLVTKYQSNIIGEIKNNIRLEMMEKAMRIGPGYLNFTSTSNMINMGSDTIEQLENYYGRFLPQFYGSFGMSLINFACIFYLNKRAAIAFLFLSPIIPLFLKAMLEMVTKKQKKYWGRYQDVAQLFLDSLQGITTLKIFNADEKRGQEIHEKSEIFRVETMKILKMQLNSITLIEWIAYGGSLLCLLLAVLDFQNGKVSLFSIVVLLFLVLDSFQPMILLTSSFHVAMTGVAAGKKLIEFLELEEIESKEYFDFDNKAELLNIKNLSFTYFGEKLATLKNINCQFSKNGYVAIVGKSGSGKSTLAQIITGQFEDYVGEIYIDDISYSKIDKLCLVENITRISHDAHVFEMTVRENLKIGSQEADDQKMIAALKQVRLYEEIKDRGGLDMKIESGATNLSGGQKQRLVLARAILHQSSVYIFDEATSNIDVESEEIIIDVLKEIAKSKIVILITHRLYCAQDAKNIYVLDKGLVVEEGNHFSLLSREGHYKKMWQAQKELEEAI